MNDKMKEMLEQQMTLLSEQSEKEHTNYEVLARLSKAMVEIADIFIRSELGSWGDR